MTTIIPIPAFRDNYIWAVRNGAHRGGRRSRRRRAGARVARRERRRAVGDPRDASPCRPCRRHRRAAARATTCPCSGLRARRFRGARTRSREGDRIDVPGVGARARGARHSRPHGGPHRVLRGRAPIRCCSAATRCSPRGCGRLFEGTPRRCGRRCRSSRRCRRPRACTAATNTRSPTCASPQAVEPGNAASRRADRARACASASAACRRCRRRSATSARPIRSCARRCRT